MLVDRSGEPVRQLSMTYNGQVTLPGPTLAAACRAPQLVGLRTVIHNETGEVERLTELDVCA